MKKLQAVFVMSVLTMGIAANSVAPAHVGLALANALGGNQYVQAGLTGGFGAAGWLGAVALGARIGGTAGGIIGGPVGIIAGAAGGAI